jgi:purine-cytosine permease-like protein
MRIQKKEIVKIIILIGITVLLIILGYKNIHIIYYNVFLISITLLSAAVVTIFWWLKPGFKENSAPPLN